jgi:hypothetical protein
MGRAASIVFGLAFLYSLTYVAACQNTPRLGVETAGTDRLGSTPAGKDPRGVARSADAAPPIAVGGLIGTGYLAGGSALAPVGSLDGNFQLLSCPSGPCPNQAFVALTGVSFPGPWVPNTGSAQWIGPAFGGVETGIDPVGVYDYQEKFDLTGFDLSTVVVTGSFAADNEADLQLNGVPAGFSSPGFHVWTPFTLASGFQPGVNTLDFLVTNFLGGYFNPSGLIVEVTGTGTRPATTTSLEAAPANLIVGQALTLTAAVRGTALPPPTGLAGFLDTGTLLATAALDQSGTAVTTLYPAPGIYSIVAGYDGDGFNAPSESAPVTVTVLPGPPTFAITTSGPLTLQTQHHGAVSVTVTPQNGFQGEVTLACGPLPQYVTCEWGSATQSEAQTQIAGGAKTVQLQIDTSAVLGYDASADSAERPGYGEGVAALAALGLLLFRRWHRLRIVLCGLVICVAASLSGCSTKLPPSTLPGTYTITIQGTSGAIQNSAGLVLIVTK